MNPNGVARPAGSIVGSPDGGTCRDPTVASDSPGDLELVIFTATAAGASASGYGTELPVKRPVRPSLAVVRAYGTGNGLQRP